MISLRLSETEYEALRSLYPAYGARNFSDFARLAMRRLIGKSAASDSAFADKVREFDDRLNALESNMTLLLVRSSP